MPDESAPPLSESSCDELAQVRKGKARRFVLLTKGSRVVSLVVYRTGSTARYVKEARESGNGVVCYGVVQGRGANLNFQLAIDDGFDAPPGKPAVLRQFLEEHADQSYKPVYEIVGSHEPVLPEGHPLAERLLKLRAATDDAVRSNPARARELFASWKKAAELLQDGDYRSAERQLLSLESALESLAIGVSTDELSRDASDKAGPDSPKRKEVDTFTPRLKELVKRGLPHAPSIGRALKQLAARARAAHDAGQEQSASEQLDEMESLVVQAEKSAEKRDRFERAKNGVEFRLENALESNPPNAGQLRAVWAYVVEKGEAGEYDSAGLALKKLAEAIAKLSAANRPEAGETGGATKGIVKARGALLNAWRDLPARMASESRRLVQQLADELEDLDLGDLEERLTRELHQLCDQIKDGIDAAINQGDSDYRTAKRAVEAARMDISNSPVMRQLLSAPFDAPFDFHAAVSESLDKIEQALAN